MIGPVLLVLLVSVLLLALLELAPGTPVVAAGATVALVLLEENEVAILPVEGEVDENTDDVEDGVGIGVCDDRTDVAEPVLETTAAVGETR